MINDPSKNPLEIAEPDWVSDPSARAALQEDADLLEIYCQTGQRQAMDSLIRRYGPMVAAVARRLIANPSDAEDVFQATFLILLRSAHKIRKTRSISAWLYGVAYRTAIRVRQRARLERTISTGDAYLPCRSDENPLSRLAREMELESLDEELQTLPDPIREPLVEHYLLGYTAPQIAERMDLHLSAVEGRLRRGRKILRQRLARRGISLSVVIAGANWFQQHVEAKELLDWANTMEASLDLESNSSLSSASHDPMIQRLVQGESTMKNSLLFKYFSFGGTAICAVGVLGLSAAAIPVNVNHGREIAVSANGETAEVSSFLLESSVSARDATEAENVELEPGGTNQGLVPKIPGKNVQSIEPENQSGPPPTTASSKRGSSGNKSTPEDVVTFSRPNTEEPAWMSTAGQDMKVISQLRKKIAETKVSVQWNGTPLRNVIAELSDAIATPILISDTSLADNGYTPDEPITVQSPDLRLSTALDLILTKKNLCYRIHPEYIEILSNDDAAREDIRYYDLAFVITDSTSIPDIVKAIQNSLTSPNESVWDIEGGTGTISTVGSMMIVRASERTHQQIERFLAEIAKLSPGNQKAKGQVSSESPMQGMGGGGMGGMGGGMF